MTSTIRRKLDMVNRVFLFSQRHAAEIQGYVTTVTLLGEKLQRAESLKTQSDAGQIEEDASTARAVELRRDLEENHLGHIVRIARAVTPADPELKQRFRKPKKGISHQAFTSAARAMAAEAAIRRELFTGEGLPESFHEDMNQALENYIAAVNQKSAGLASHVGARADLRAVTKELMALVRRLDGINRFRFRKDPELLAAWKSARDVSWPAAAKAAGINGDGVVKPAA